MTLDQLRPVVNRLLDPAVSVAARIGLTPNAISVIAFGMALIAGGCYYFGAEVGWLYLVGALLVAANGILDLLDGALARAQDVHSPAGDLLDHVLDRYADVVLLAGLAAGIEAYALGFAAVTGVLLTSYLGTQIQAVGADREYGGLLGRADRLALIGIVGVASVLFPGTVVGYTLIGWLLLVFAIVGHLTALQRFFGAWSSLQ